MEHQYVLNLPHFTKCSVGIGDDTALRHIPGSQFDNTVRVYKPTHIEAIMRNIIGPSFDQLIAEQEVIQC